MEIVNDDDDNGDDNNGDWCENDDDNRLFLKEWKEEKKTTPSIGQSVGRSFSFDGHQRLLLNPKISLSKKTTF